MEFSVGYRVLPGEPDYFCDIVRDYRPRIREIYFAWPGEASGRAPLEPGAQEQLAWELDVIRGLGVSLNLLINASCYGDEALSPAFAARVVDQIRKLKDGLGLNAVTTMSPIVARAIRKQVAGIDIRASVNMRLGTVRAMDYVAGFFDSYCLQREYNRDPERLAELRTWAEANGKTLHALVNSGCLNFCSFQAFHDNAVAHEGTRRKPCASGDIPTLCSDYYASPDHRHAFLQGSWIRPEDMAAHQRIFGGRYKLATRLHDNPRLVIAAYAEGRFYGNLLDLMEPGLGRVFFPDGLDNRAFPPEWFDRTTRCRAACGVCGYCREVYERVRLDLSGAIPCAARRPA